MMHWGRPRSLTLLGLCFALCIAGAAWLKTRQLANVARRAEMLPSGFVLPRSHFERDAFEAAPGCSDSTALAEFRRAMQWHQRGDEASARRALLRLVQREPTWARARFQLGVSQLHLGFPVAAVDELSRARQAGFRPEGESLDWWLAVAEIYNGRPDRARDLLRAIRQGPRADSARELLQRLDDIR
jgi:hypothetical protein